MAKPPFCLPRCLAITPQVNSLSLTFRSFVFMHRLEHDMLEHRVSAASVGNSTKNVHMCVSFSFSQSNIHHGPSIYCTSFLGYCQQQKDTQLVGLAYTLAKLCCYIGTGLTLSLDKGIVSKCFQHMLESPSVFKNRPANHMTGTCNMLSIKEFAAQVMNKSSSQLSVLLLNGAC